MNKIIQTCILLLLTALPAMAADDMGAFWGKATQLYKQKQYDSAATYFEKIATLKPKNAEVYYNLGNTYYRLNKVGMAVLNYRRALHLNPDYVEAKENLALTESRMANHVAQAKDIFFIGWWQTITAANNATLWAVLAFIVFSAIALVVFLRGVSKIVIGIPAQVPYLLGFIWICLLILAYASAQNSQDSGLAVIMQNDAPLLGDGMKGKPLSLLPEGTTVKVNATKGEYAEIIIPDGRKGYILQSWIAKI